MDWALCIASSAKQIWIDWAFLCVTSGKKALSQLNASLWCWKVLDFLDQGLDMSTFCAGVGDTGIYRLYLSWNVPLSIQHRTLMQVRDEVDHQGQFSFCIGWPYQYQASSRARWLLVTMTSFGLFFRLCSPSYSLQPINILLTAPWILSQRVSTFGQAFQKSCGGFIQVQGIRHIHSRARTWNQS